MKLSNLALSLLALALPFGAAAEGHHARGRHARHTDIARRADAGMELYKRYSDSRWTFYDVGLGSCGKTNVPSDFIVALNSAQFDGPGYKPHCWETITMTYNGKTTQAQITDRCPGCPFGGLDLSRGLFDFFASEDAGVIYGSWSFAGEGDPSPAPKPTTTSKAPVWTPTTTWHPIVIKTTKPTPTTTWTPEPTTTSTKTSSTPSSSSTPVSSTSTKASSSSAASSSAPASSSVKHVSSAASSPTAVPTGALSDINVALISLGSLVVSGAQTN
ncbi:hypothetical protein P691DRAFT_805135 [Macrolepiota fuliginosa MF-IS2]|uniref:RlpA-like protein double-psi beta-barrel domain-containing protein n=1 Tax=Macrolepiota fuliginosa MF-IS2 TaxID=1400762 RepID=A0A9P5XK74_9AGAR|nr:hypothetical protein P691DRAFT_805135 [Macrolepiota fuliginosa MF-IS2]